MHGTTSGRIVETEAYLGIQDRAAHSWRGVVPRTRVMFGEPGHAYVYLIFHESMRGARTWLPDREGSPGCVLIRALEPLEGIPRMRRRRPGARGIEGLANGPGKLTLALGITRRYNGADLTTGPLTTIPPHSPRRRRTDPGRRFPTYRHWRIAHDWPLRFFIEGNRFVGNGDVTFRLSETHA